MKVLERLQKLQDDEYYVVHKSLGKEQMISEDWIRIKYINRDWENVKAVDVKDMWDLPNNLLEKEIIEEKCWMIGGFLALDLYIAQ